MARFFYWIFKFQMYVNRELTVAYFMARASFVQPAPDGVEACGAAMDDHDADESCEVWELSPEEMDELEEFLGEDDDDQD